VQSRKLVLLNLEFQANGLASEIEAKEIYFDYPKSTVVREGESHGTPTFYSLYTEIRDSLQVSHIFA
jgi:hypothetical protein